MKPSHLLAATVLAALLALTARPVLANGAPPRVPYRRPAQLQQPIEPTTHAHLEAAQDALRIALDLLTTFNSAGPRAGMGTNLNTFYYGGYIARAQEDLKQAIVATAEATTYVGTHPEVNPLVAGPVPADEPSNPPLPKIPAATINASNLVQAVDAVNAALEAMVNNPARNYHGPVLGDVGGHRAKVIAAIARAGTDLNASFAYYQNTRGGSTGIIPLLVPANLPPDPKYGPTARLYLEQVRSMLDTFTTSLAAAGANFTGDSTQGGYVPKVEADLQRTTADLTAAVAYLDAHPEADALTRGPAGPEPSTVHPAAIPPYVRWGTAAPKLVSARVTSINGMLVWLQNNTTSGFHGTALGDIGGYRGKILDDLGQTLADIQAGIDFTAQDPTAPVPATLPTRRGPAATINRTPAPGAMLESRPAPTTDPSPLPGPAGLAGLALSLGASLGGLAFLARKK
jgi:hypothetical protein